MFEFADLRDQLAHYLTPAQVEQISQAYLLAEQAHSGQKRHSGEPYISHPLEVARILANMRMDHESIIAAILHDVLEDTSVDKSTIEKAFGEKVAELVDGVSKLTQIEFASKEQAQAENFRKMMLAMAKDIRVIFIKLADRLHNMRTISAMSRRKQKQKALETLEIYAPIAARLGMNNLRIEYEDLGFQALYPMRYRILKESVRKARGNRSEIIKTVENALQANLEKSGMTYQALWGREKHLYSIYKKMRQKGHAFHEIMDVYAVRLIVDSRDSCYRALGVVHRVYKPVLGRFKDYIAVPKNNGYQSLHTSLLGPYGVPIEIQIRTEAMDRMAENGIAAHWRYKSNHSSAEESNLIAHQAQTWMKNLLEIQESTVDSLEFVENVKVDLFPDEVYVFTPKGTILALPSGSTPVDFAYAVHTQLGNTCVACKIDRRLAPLSSRLVSGQTIEIITTPGAHPNPAWLSFVVSGKSRSNIRQWLKSRQKSESQALGQRLLEKALNAYQLTWAQINEVMLQKCLQESKIPDASTLFEEVGLGKRLAALVAKQLVMTDAPHDLVTREDQPLTIKGTEGMVITYATCCYPLPGDPIIGLSSKGKGIVIHQEHCAKVKDVHLIDKVIHVKWEDDLNREFAVEIQLDVENTPGVLAKIAKVIAESNSNISNLSMEEKDGVFISMYFVITVRNRAHLARVIRRLKSLDAINHITRNKS